MIVGDDDTGSRTGRWLPVRYALSSLGFCAVLSGVDGVAQVASASANGTIMRRCMKWSFGRIARRAGSRWDQKSGDCTGDRVRARKT